MTQGTIRPDKDWWEAVIQVDSHLVLTATRGGRPTRWVPLVPGDHSVTARRASDRRLLAELSFELRDGEVAVIAVTPRRQRGWPFMWKPGGIGVDCSVLPEGGHTPRP